MPTATRTTKKTAAKTTTARKAPAKKSAVKKSASATKKKAPQPPAAAPIPIRAAPADLDDAGQKLWSEITTSYQLRPDEYRILEDAAREADLVEHLVAVQRDSSVMIPGSMGQLVLHPVIAEVRQHRATLSQLLVKLKLPDDPGVPAAGGAAPAGNDRANQARAAANARWSRRGS